MRLTLLTGSGPEHRYVAGVLNREVGLSAIVVDDGPHLTRTDRLAVLRRRYDWSQLVSRAGLAALRWLVRDDRQRRHELGRVLPGEVEAFPSGVPVVRVRGVNTAEGQQAVQAIEFDRLLIYGTGIVGQRVLASSPEPPLNMHTGISPHYRGSSCAFWPLHNGELDMLGATVHEVTADVDGGRIYGTARARLDPSDGLHAVFARCVVVGAALFTTVLHQLSLGLAAPVDQDLTVGREYRAVMRGPVAELRVRAAIRSGLVRRWAPTDRAGIP